MKNNEESKTLATENRMVTEPKVSSNNLKMKSFSMSKDEEEEHKNKTFFDKLIISESSKWKAVFDIWMLILVGYSWITSIFYVAFTAPTNLYHIIFDWSVEVCFFSDLVFNFFQEYKDPETYENIKSHKKIAMKYIFKGWFIVDFISVFPFVAVLQQNALITKLFRLFRLPRLIKLIDISRFNKLLKSFFESSSRDERIVAQYMLMYFYKIFRLIIIAIIITYFLGCLWYFISNEVNSDSTSQTFAKTFGLVNESDARKLIVSCYFALTTLSTVGYGDYYPLSNIERIVAWVVMLLGVAFFSFIMGNFIEIITSYDQKMGIIDKGTDLHNWMTLLTRYTNNKPLPKSLINSIDGHFTYFWANDRLSSVSKDDKYMSALPISIKRTIMINYLFQDVFYKFRQFFHTFEQRENEFLYDISFGFLPRKFEENEIIYDEEDEVPEIYFIMEGNIGVGFRIPGRDTNNIKLIKYFKDDSFICDYYVCHNKRSEFVYQSVRETKVFAIQRKFLKEVFKIHSEIAAKIKAESITRYAKFIRDPIHFQRRKEIEDKIILIFVKYNLYKIKIINKNTKRMWFEIET